jgi:hypothetical protein
MFQPVSRWRMPLAALAAIVVVAGLSALNAAATKGQERASVPSTAVTAGENPAVAREAATAEDCSASDPLQSTADRQCKPCKNKPYCGCTYNGLPRVSCEPCCYGYFPPGTVCLD